MKNRRFFLILSFLSNMLIFVMAFYAVGMSFRHQGRAEFGGSGFITFRFFTTDSNILAGILSLIAGFTGLRALVRGEDRLPAFAVTLKYIGAVAVSLTFTVVLVFLGPVFGYGSMYLGSSFYMHGVIPILTVVSFIAFDRGKRLPKRTILFAMIPVVLYGIVYFTEVVLIGQARGGWKDFYGFTRGGCWWLSLILCFGGAALLAVLIRLLHNACEGRKEKNS